MTWERRSARAHQRPEPPRQEGRAPQVVSNDISCHVDQAADLQYIAEAVSPRADSCEISQSFRVF